MAKIRVILETPDPEAYRTGELLEAEFVPGGTRFWMDDMWYSPNQDDHTKVFATDEVVKVSD